MADAENWPPAELAISGFVTDAAELAVRVRSTDWRRRSLRD
jgi:hypothetical protein